MKTLTAQASPVSVSMSVSVRIVPGTAPAHADSLGYLAHVTSCPRFDFAHPDETPTRGHSIGHNAAQSRRCANIVDHVKANVATSNEHQTTVGAPTTPRPVQSWSLHDSRPTLLPHDA